MSKKTALVILAPDNEENEFSAVVNVLRRCGVEVTVAGLEGPDIVKCRMGIFIKPDTSLEFVAETTYDAVCLPGGYDASKNLAESKLLGDVLKKHDKAGKILASICAASTAFAANRIQLGKSLTSYPRVREQLVDDYKYVDDKAVVQDGTMITSRGPGTALEWALKIAENLVEPEVYKEVRRALLVDRTE